MATKKDISEIRHALEDNKVALAELLSVTKSNADKLTAFQASLELAFTKIDSLEKETIPALEDKTNLMETKWKQQQLVTEARSMQYNIVFLNPPALDSNMSDDSKARSLIQLCGVPEDRAGSMLLKRAHPLPRRRKPGSTSTPSPNFLAAFVCWEEKELVLKSARSKPDQMGDMRATTQWPPKIKSAHFQLKSSTAYKSAKQNGKNPYVKIDFRTGKVGLIIADKTVKQLEAWSLPDLY